MVAHDKLFTAASGKSFKCKSENLLLMSSQLRIKLVPLQIQAFTLPKGQYGKGDSADHLASVMHTFLKLLKPETNLKRKDKDQTTITISFFFLYSAPPPRLSYVSEVECWADFNKRVIPIIIGAVVVCLILIAVLTYLFIRDRRRQEYESL